MKTIMVRYRTKPEHADANVFLKSHSRKYVEGVADLDDIASFDRVPYIALEAEFELLG